ncbi:hypothetical protein GUI04_22635, partial [Xanthomonas citri pv. citri]|nr:hypothetical protein [Xanthomonas citri pv. citri]
LQYHNGALLTGDISVNFIWYGNFKPSQKAIVSDFITSLSEKPQKSQVEPSVATWWKTTEKYQLKSKKHGSLTLRLGKQIS